MSIIPRPLKLGDTIGVMAPSSYVEREDIEAARDFIEARGYKVFIHPQTYARENQSAGSHVQKAAAFHELWDNSDIKALWMAGGGNRCLHLLEHINFARLRATPKSVIGFSDVTALLNALYAHCKFPSIHGPVFKNAHKHAEIDALFDLLEGRGATLSLEEADILHEGEAQGSLIGGNLSIFQYLPQILPDDFWTNGLLFLEDCNEDLSKLDRMLVHLKRLGVFEQINGLIFGDFTNLTETGRAYGYSLDDIIREHTQTLNIPIIMNADFGHGPHLFPFFVGRESKLSTTLKTLEMPRFS